MTVLTVYAHPKPNFFATQFFSSSVKDRSSKSAMKCLNPQLTSRAVVFAEQTLFQQRNVNSWSILFLPYCGLHSVRCTAF